MDSTTQQWNFAEGTDVVGSDGDKVGEVVAVQPNYIVVEKGFFFPTDYYIPTSAVANYDGDKVYLSVTKDEALNQGWDSMPQEDAAFTETTTTYGTATTGSYTADMGATDVSVRDTTTYDTAPADTGMAASAYETETVVTDDRYAASGRSTTVMEGDTISVPVHEEELSATTRNVEVGQVEITKDVVSEQRTLEVPVTEERVRVERRVVDRDATADEVAFEEGVIEVPLRAEEVELHKRTRVAEEIEIGKEAVQRTEQVAGTVRREVVDVSERVVDDVRGAARTVGTDVERDVRTAETDVERGAESVGDKMRDMGRDVRNAVSGDDKPRR